MTLPRAARRLLVAAVSLLACGAAHAVTEADLKWDLSYRRALQEHPIAPAEFMWQWIAGHPQRPIHTRLAEYAGEPIEATLLIEQPDGHTGDPSASWFIKTRSSASVCTFHPKLMHAPCKPLDPARAEQFIRSVLHFTPLAPGAGAQTAEKGPDGKPILLNYMGFLSMYVDGVALQRPIAIRELTPAASGADPQAGRLERAVAALTLSDAAFAQRQAGMDKRARQQRLNDAAKAGDPERLRQLLGEGATVSDSDLAEALTVAAANGRHRALDFLLARGARIDAGESAALKAAVRAGDDEMVRHLLERGARVDPAAEAGRTIYQSALGLAVQLRSESMARLLLARGAQVNLPQSRTPLTSAAIGADLAMVDLLLKAGAKPDQSTPGDPRTPLMFLMSYSGKLGGLPQDPAERQAIARTEAGLAAVARRLVASGADVNAITAACGTAYLEASERHSEAMQALLQSLGADPRRHERCERTMRQGEQGSTDGAEMRAREAITSATRDLLERRDYAGLDALYLRLKGPQHRTPSGKWDQALFYHQLKSFAHASGEPAYWADLQAQAAAWKRHSPASLPARLFAVYLHLQHALSVRGDGDSTTVNAAQRAEMAALSSAALDILGAARPMALKAGDPEWYRAMLSVLPYSNGYAVEAMNRVLDEGMARYPDYHDMVFTAAFYAHPRWYASPDAADRIARRAGESARGEQASLYARVYWYLDQFEYRGRLFDTGLADWPTMRTSLAALVAQYPDPWNLNAAAYFACQAKDYWTMDELLGRIGDQLVFAVWGDNGAVNYAACAANRPADTDAAARSRYEAGQAAVRQQRLGRLFYEFINAGVAMRKLGQFERSLEALRGAEDTDRKLGRRASMMAQYHLGWTLAKMGRHQQAVEAFTRGLEAQPDYEEAYWRRGMAYEALGRRQQAQDDYATGARYLRRHPQADSDKLDENGRAILREMRDTFRRAGEAG
ncbi:MAG: ankyrin repeat domain-containing protein [Massilia sp.]